MQKRHDTTFVSITGWENTVEIKRKIKELIAAGTYKQEEIRMSSQRFANKVDKSAGYEARILVKPGIHPELETDLKYSHGTPRIKNEKALASIRKGEKPMKIDFKEHMNIAGTRYQILEVVNNKSRTKLYYWLRDRSNLLKIGVGPYTKDYKNIRIVKECPGEYEEVMGEWMMLCNLVTSQPDDKAVYADFLEGKVTE